MKKFSLLTLSLLCATALVSCGKDKNEMQPQLGQEARTPINQGYGQQPPMLDPNTGNPMIPGIAAPTGSEAEVFTNQNVGLGALPPAMPGGFTPPGAPVAPDMNAMGMGGMPAGMGNMQDNMMAQQIQADMNAMQQMPAMPMAPMMQAPAPAMQPAPNFIPTSPAVAQAPVVQAVAPQQAVDENGKRLPASLVQGYNNPLNFEVVPVMPPMMPMAPMMEQPMAAPMAPMMGGGMMPVNAPTMPVQNMQLIPQSR